MFDRLPKHRLRPLGLFTLHRRKWKTNPSKFGPPCKNRLFYRDVEQVSDMKIGGCQRDNFVKEKRNMLGIFVRINESSLLSC